MLKPAALGYDLKPTKMTLKAFIETWLLEVVTPKLRPATIQSCESAAKLLESLTPRDVQSCINGILATDLSPRSAAHALAILRSALGTVEKAVSGAEGLLIRASSVEIWLATKRPKDRRWDLSVGYIALAATHRRTSTGFVGAGREQRRS